MGVLTREQLTSTIRERIGEDTSDSAISLLTDLTDTLNDYDSKLQNNGVDWEKKFNENDKMWRQKYIERFESGTPNEPQNPPNTNQSETNNNQQEDTKKKKFSDLFTRKGDKK